MWHRSAPQPLTVQKRLAAPLLGPRSDQAPCALAARHRQGPLARRAARGRPSAPDRSCRARAAGVRRPRQTGSRPPSPPSAAPQSPAHPSRALEVEAPTGSNIHTGWVKCTEHVSWRNSQTSRMSSSMSWFLGCYIQLPSHFGLMSDFVWKCWHASRGVQAKELARTQRHEDTQLCGVVGWQAAQAESAPGRRTSGIGHLRAARAVCSTNTPVSHGDCRYGSRRWCDAPSRYPAQRRHTLESAARAALAS